MRQTPLSKSFPGQAPLGKSFPGQAPLNKSILARGRRATGALCAAVALAACFGSATENRAIELRFWALGREGEVVTTLVRDFEREHPNIRVRVQQIPWTAAHEKLLTAYVGESVPDVAQMGNTWLSEFAALGALAPLEGSVRASGVVSEGAYFAGIWDTNIIDEQLVGIPWYVDTRVMFYRKDLLEQAGVRGVPETWIEWYDAMRRIKDSGEGDRYGIFLPTNEWTQAVILGMQAGSPLLKDGGRYGAFSDSAFRQAFSFYLKLYRDGVALAAGNTQIGNVYQEFARGRFAMYITGPWNIGEFKSRLPSDVQDKWATAPLPGPTGLSSGVSTAGGSSLVLFERSPHKREAWQLIEYLSRPEQQVRFYQLTGDLPANIAAWRDTTLANNEYTRAFYDQLQRARSTPKVPEWELITTKIIEYAERTIRSTAPMDAALSALDADVNRILEKRRWMLERQANSSGSAVVHAGAP